jgi:hypothetical protein
MLNNQRFLLLGGGIFSWVATLITLFCCLGYLYYYKTTCRRCKAIKFTRVEINNDNVHKGLDEWTQKE